jgi:hypothetical protein
MLSTQAPEAQQKKTTINAVLADASKLDRNDTLALTYQGTLLSRSTTTLLV